jgi:hypothetical protein
VNAAPSQSLPRRPLRFHSPAQAIADAEAIAEADAAGRLRRTGNWSAGQALGHIAAWIDFAFDGYPLTVTPEAAAIARRFLPQVLEKGMQAGYRFAGVEGGTVGTDDMPAPAALERLRRAWDRLAAKAPPREHVFFGPLTHDQWIALNLRHAELHQGFLFPEG